MLKESLVIVQRTVGEMQRCLNESMHEFRTTVFALDERVVASEEGISDSRQQIHSTRGNIDDLKQQLASNQDKTLTRFREFVSSFNGLHGSVVGCQSSFSDCWDELRDCKSDVLTCQETMKMHSVSTLRDELYSFQQHSTNVLNKIQSDARLADELTRDGRDRLERLEAQVYGIHSSLRETAHGVITLQHRAADQEIAAAAGQRSADAGRCLTAVAQHAACALGADAGAGSHRERHSKTDVDVAPSPLAISPVPSMVTPAHLQTVSATPAPPADVSAIAARTTPQNADIVNPTCQAKPEQLSAKIQRAFIHQCQPQVQQQQILRQQRQNLQQPQLLKQLQQPQQQLQQPQQPQKSQQPLSASPCASPIASSCIPWVPGDTRLGLRSRSPSPRQDDSTSPRRGSGIRCTVSPPAGNPQLPGGDSQGSPFGPAVWAQTLTGWSRVSCSHAALPEAGQRDWVLS